MRQLPTVLLSISLIVLSGVSAVAHAASSAKLSWTIPTARENGQALAVSELTGYEIYYTTDTNSSGTIKVIGGTTASYTVQNLAAGTYHFAISAVDTNGFKSKLSTVADVTLAASTAAPIAPSSTSAATTSATTGLNKAINVGWVAPTARTDGASLSVTELSGYLIVVGSPTATTSAMVSGGSVNSYVMSNIKTGTYILAIAAIDKSGHKSAFASRMISVQ